MAVAVAHRAADAGEMGRYLQHVMRTPSAYAQVRFFIPRIKLRMRGLLRRPCWLPACCLRMRCAMHASLLPVSLRGLTLIMQVSSLE